MILHEPAAVAAPQAKHGDVHLTCCLDWNVGLCGKDLSHADVEGDDDAPVTCVVCNDLNDESPQFCPKHPFCRVYSVPV